jgi:glucose-6-phosphate 1-epimerase
MSSPIQELETRFPDTGVLFEPAGDGLVKLHVRTESASAEVFPLGGTVTAYRPTGQAPVIFTSSRTFLKPGKAIRGGVPICWPWFGPHPTDPKQPQHGLVRSMMWTVDNITRRVSPSRA